MPEVAIFAAYSASAMVPTWVEVPDVATANKIKALAGHDKTASVFVKLPRHERDDKCKCFVCDQPAKRFERPSWSRVDPIKPYVRFDVGARNVRFKVRGGEFFVVVADRDVNEWLATLPLNFKGNERLALELALPLTLERTKSRREVDAA